MNGRYLFKAKRKNWQELPKEEWWVAGLLMKMCNRLHIIETDNEHISHEIVESTICQCTEWKNKDEKLIFENDIVEYDGKAGVVKFGYYTWDESENIGFYIDWDTVDYRKDLGWWLDKIRVAGSYIDNPELLEVE